MPVSLTIRPATPADVPAIAALHARSWQLAYRGDFTDHYLDVECPVERLEVWTNRFAQPNPDMLTTVAEVGGVIVGFCCTFYAFDAYGSYLDNLHVAPEYQRQGVGKQLLADAARRVAQRDPDGEIYLLVLTSNAQAITFYQRRQGRFGEVKTKDLAGTEVEVVAVHWRVRALVTG